MLRNGVADDGPLLARAAFDRAAHRRTDDAWLDGAWRKGRVLRISAKSATPVGDPGAPALSFGMPDEIEDAVPRRFLGIADGVAYFTVTVERTDGTWLTLRELGGAVDDLQAGLFTSAIALEQWHQRHTHCPRCGTPTREAAAGWMRVCPADESQHFPRTDPAVIMLVHDGGDRALLGQGVAWGGGRYSTLAGFVEPGESLEAAVAREVSEEVGVRVTDIRYVASQPWPFPSSLMLGFSALLDGTAEIRLDPGEMAAAAWFGRDEVRRAAAAVDSGYELGEDVRLRAVSPKLSISRYLIDRWLDGTLPD